jgi:hypothetical protein
MLLAQPAVPAAVPQLEATITASQPDEWNTVHGMIVDKAGNLYVLDNSEQRVKVFTAQGRLIRTIGRKGQGPGEFQSASRMQLLRDSLWVFDHVNNRVTVFQLNGKGLRTFPLVEPAGRTETAIMYVSANGFWLIHAEAESDSRRVTGAHSWHFGTRERFGPTILTIEPEKTVVVPMKPDRSTGKSTGRGHFRHPITTTPLWAVTRDGSSIIYMERNTAARSGTGEIVLSAHASSGRVLWSRTLKYPPMPVTRSERNLLLDSIARPKSATTRLGRAAVFEVDRGALSDSLNLPPFWPPVKSLHSATDGTIWLEEGGRSAKPTYLVLSPQGVPERRVTLPASSRLLVASRERIWVFRLDPDDLPLVERYRIPTRTNTR